MQHVGHSGAGSGCSCSMYLTGAGLTTGWLAGGGLGTANRPGSSRSTGGVFPRSGALGLHSSPAESDRRARTEGDAAPKQKRPLSTRCLCLLLDGVVAGGCDGGAGTTEGGAADGSLRLGRTTRPPRKRGMPVHVVGVAWCGFEKGLARSFASRQTFQLRWWMETVSKVSKVQHTKSATSTLASTAPSCVALWTP